MKNKLLVCAFAMAFVAFTFTSCKENVDMDAICDNVSTTTLQGMFSGAALYGDSLIVSEYNFQNDGSVDFTLMAMGDGIYAAPISIKYASWSFGEYNEQNLGRYVILNPENGGEPMVVNFTRASIYEDALPVMGDKNDKVAELPKLQSAIVDKDWHGLDTTFFKIDTIINVLHKDTFSHRDIIGYSDKGRPIYGLVIDSIVDRIVPTRTKWIVGPSKIAERRLVLNRDPQTLVNTGSWYLMLQEFEYDKQRHATQTLDTVAQYDFHWTFTEYKSASAFSIFVNGTEHSEVFELKYDAKVPSITLDKQVLKIDTIQ